MNKLSREKSPYLQQHAMNPVDWLPWGPEAFARARAEGKPLLVSVGYSTCHWCHVMERESFDDRETAAVMNRELVCVKVDREERPDVDRILMTAVQALTGQGGWPLNVFLTPEGRPFLGGTYFPPESRGGRPAWRTVVERIGAAWRDPYERARMTAQADHLRGAVEGYLAGERAPEEAAASRAVDALFDDLAASFDATEGGFGPAPKFPMPGYSRFLLRFADGAGAAGDPRTVRARAMVGKTLSAMAAGGIHDRLGGGFHRYSTDERWRVPHFEKMLYDNAPLASLYLDAYRALGDAAWAAVARGTLDYLLADLRHAAGGFCSAEDADSLPPGAPAGSEKREGAFYLWSETELDAWSGEGAALARRAYGVVPGGNAPDPLGEFDGKSVLLDAASAETLAAEFGRTPEETRRVLEAARARLREARRSRPRPFLDDKIITAWNGLAIEALARGAAVLEEERYAVGAERAAEFLREKLWDADSGTLYRRWREGERGIPGQSDDYIFLAWGLLALFEATFEPAWLQWAETLADRFRSLFMDGAPGAVFATAAGYDPHALVRAREEGDNVEPSASSLAVDVFRRLARLRGRPDLAQAAAAILKDQLGRAAAAPRAYPWLLTAALEEIHPAGELVVAGRPGNEATRRMLAAARSAFRPDVTVLLADQGPGQARLAERLPHVAGMKVPVGRARAYFCRNGVCEAPMDTPEDLRRRLAAVPRR